MKKQANNTKKAQAQAPQEEEVQIVTTADILAEEAAEVAANAAADAGEILEDLADNAAEAVDDVVATATDKKAVRAEKRAERKAARAEKREERKAAKALRPSCKERRAARKAEFEALPLTQQEAIKNARLGRKVMIGTAVFGLAAIGGLTAVTAIAACRKGSGNVNDVVDPATIDAGGTAGLKGSVNCGF